jgi:gliding motility-associated-like protein
MFSKRVKKNKTVVYKKPMIYIGTLLCALCFSLSAQSQLTANFTSDQQTQCAPAVIRFFDQSTGGPTSWEWDLGNGSGAVTIQNPTATYFTPGTYTVKLVIRNATGADSITKTNFITILGPPQVNFVADDTVGCFNHKVQFTDQTVTSNSGSISSWFWDFGDGTNSNQQNPLHVYTLSGNFTVNLTVTQSNGCVSTFTRPQYITVTPGVTADFFSPFPSGCKPPVSIPLQNLTTGPGTLSYDWDFGNGGPGSNAVNPVAIYNTAGNYIITLIATSSAGCFDTVRKPVVIPTVTVTSSFNAPDTACLGQTISFQNTSNPDPDSSFWTFGDGTFSNILNPVKVFSSPGLYNVKMVNKFGSCVDSFSKTIVILSNLPAAFTSSNPSSCRVPLSVNFTGVAPGAVTWNWNFGDGTTGTGPNPTHNYTDTGKFNVRLTVANNLGCSNTINITDYVKISPPRITVSNLPDSGCAPFTITPNVSVYAPDGVQSYFWDFGDGVTSNLPNPSHQYNSIGSYTVRLRITTTGGCQDSVSFINGVKVGTIPAGGADFSGSPLSTCAGQPVSFVDLSPNPILISGWRWDFGDTTTSSIRNPVHIYADTGRFNVSLTVFNNGCGTTVTKNNYVQVFGAVARFNYTVNCTNKTTVSFRDSSLNTSAILWDFGDGSPTTTNPNPIHTFPGRGNYTVSLTATNGSCTFVEKKIISIVDEPADFNMSQNPICKGSRIVISAINSIDSNISRYDWDFGDGVYVGFPRSNQSSYPTSGLFTIRLRVTDVNGCLDSSSQVLSVGETKAGLGAVNPSGCVGLTVNFIDSSRSSGTNNIVSRIWDFGDGVIQTINAPPYQHTYNLAGSYNVKLKVLDAAGCSDSIVFTNFVNVSEPKAAFTTTDSLSCPGKIIQFVNQTGGTINNFTWDLGDGTISTVNNPAHIYPGVGQYSIKLKIRDRYGCEDSLTKTNFVNIDLPVADYTLSDSLSTCPPLDVQFTFKGKYNQSVRWEFGDGGASDLLNPRKVYNLAGTYITRLIVTSPGGCTDTLEKTITILGPSAIIAYNPIGGCDSLTVDFRSLNTTNVDSIIWDFDDGFVITKDSSITHTYTNVGNYLPRVILQDINGCRVPLMGVDTIKVVGITPAFVSSPRLLCDRGFVQFTDSTKSNGRLTSWLWDFGDGTNSSLQNPRHFYSVPGFYNVTLTVGTEFGCFETITIPNYIKIVNSPVTDIVASALAVCQDGLLTFQGIETIPDTSALTWSWNFANGQTSQLQNPPAQQFRAPGVFTVRLVTTNSSGCTDTTNQLITINPLPAVVATPDSTICQGQSVQLNATGANTYLWLPPVNNLSCTACPNPIASPAVTTTYQVRGTTAFGCDRIDSVRITVIEPSTVVAPPDDSLCLGQSLVLRATGTQVYSWTPAASLNNPNVPGPIARPVTTTTYTVTGSDFKGCFTTTDTVMVSVFPLPTVNLGPDITISAGTTDLQLNAQYSTDVLALLWSPASGLSCTTCPNPIAAPKITTTYTLSVTNNGGCTSSDAMTVFVVCTNENIFMPNTFSPNGDGMNDIYYPRGRGINTIRGLRIFTRWGQMVYSKANFNANDPSQGWDGTFRGSQLPPDVYVYTLELVCENQTIITLKGDITLVR